MAPSALVEESVLRASILRGAHVSAHTALWVPTAALHALVTTVVKCAVDAGSVMVPANVNVRQASLGMRANLHAPVMQEGPSAVARAHARRLQVQGYMHQLHVSASIHIMVPAAARLYMVSSPAMMALHVHARAAPIPPAPGTEPVLAMADVSASLVSSDTTAQSSATIMHNVAGQAVAEAAPGRSTAPRAPAVGGAGERESIAAAAGYAVAIVLEPSLRNRASGHLAHLVAAPTARSPRRSPTVASGICLPTRNTVAPSNARITQPQLEPLQPVRLSVCYTNTMASACSRHAVHAFMCRS